VFVGSSDLKSPWFGLGPGGSAMRNELNAGYTWPDPKAMTGDQSPAKVDIAAHGLREDNDVLT
jgi:hypothetical protein